MLIPLSRKQALSAAKMQELAPELKEMKEKYKDDPQSMQRKTLELYRKHKFNPFGGLLARVCAIAIFMGLYRALMLDVEMRGAPLFGEEIRWCSYLGCARSIVLLERVPSPISGWSTWLLRTVFLMFCR